MGLPMVTSSESIRAREDQIVVSVGPYIFQTDPQVDTRRVAKSRSIASPPQRILRRRSPFHPDSNNNRQVAGVACITVAPELLNALAKAVPSMAVSRLANSIRAPTIKGKNNSRPAISNPKVVTASTTSFLASPGSRAIEHKKLVRERC